MQEYINNIQPDPIDNRDYLFLDTVSTGVLPSVVDHRPYIREIEDQLRTGSCVANATVSALELLSTKAGKHHNLSRLFLYYNLREPYANLKDKDIGSYLRDGFKFVNQLGICQESEWPFIESQVNIKPSESVYMSASGTKVQEYRRVAGFSPFINFADEQAVISMKIAIAKGYPVTVSMALGKTFYNLRDVKTLEAQKYRGMANDSIGGHAMSVVGYSDTLQGFIVENSWGKDWGDNGCCLISYDVMRADCNDVWVCTKFDNLTIEEEFLVSPTTPLVVQSQELTYAGSAETGAFTQTVIPLKAIVSGGTPPYKFNWSVITGLGSKDFFIGDLNSQEILYSIPVGSKSLHAPGCVVTDSSLEQQSIRVNFSIKMMEPKPLEPIPEPIEPKPVEPVKPVEPKPSKKLNIWQKFIAWLKKLFKRD